jgi:hypothetical protein
LILIDDGSDNNMKLFTKLVDDPKYDNMVLYDNNYNIMNDILGYSIMFGRIDKVNYMLNKFDKLDPYGLFHKEIYSFFGCAFQTKNVNTIQWIINTYPDVFCILDYHFIFEHYVDSSCIPILNMIYEKQPIIIKVYGNLLIKHGKKDEKFIEYLLGFPSITLSSESITHNLHYLTPGMVDKLLSRYNIDSLEHDQLVELTANMYFSNNILLLDHFLVKYPHLLRYDETHIENLFKLCVLNGAQGTSKKLVAEKKIDVNKVISSIKRYDYIRYSLHLYSDFEIGMRMRELSGLGEKKTRDALMDFNFYNYTIVANE